MKLTHFGTVALPQDNGEFSLPVQARSSLIDLPGGAFDQDGGSLYLRPARIKARGYVVGEAVDSTVDALLAEAGKGRRLLRGLMRNGYDYRQTWAKLTNIQRERRPGMIAQQPLVLEFEQDYPYWLATADEPVYLDQGYTLDGSWTVTAGHIETQALSASPHTFTITNGGGARVPRGYLLVEPRAASSLSNLRLVNSANLMEFTFSGSLSAGDSLEIEFLTKTVKVNGSNAYSSFSTPASQLDWMTLALGANLITITGTVAGTIDLYWQWSRHYL